MRQMKADSISEKPNFCRVDADIVRIDHQIPIPEPPIRRLTRQFLLLSWMRLEICQLKYFWGESLKV